MRFSNAEIAMYFADHNPPHFHVVGRDGAAQVFDRRTRSDRKERARGLGRGAQVGEGEQGPVAREVE
jgi:hypothetical protein